MRQELTAFIKKENFMQDFLEADEVGNSFEEKLNELLQKYTMVSGLRVDSDIEITGIITPTVKANVKIRHKIA